MKSIKPGRGPSMMSGITSLLVALFGVFWTIAAMATGFGFMAIFGVIFIGVAVIQAVYNFKNATGENRYSSYDITDGDEEQDPFNEYFGKPDGNSQTMGSDKKASGKSVFCPYCGTPVEGDYAYCNKCGKKLP